MLATTEQSVAASCTMSTAALICIVTGGGAESDVCFVGGGKASSGRFQPSSEAICVSESVYNVGSLEMMSEAQGG